VAVALPPPPLLAAPPAGRLLVVDDAFEPVAVVLADGRAPTILPGAVNARLGPGGLVVTAGLDGVRLIDPRRGLTLWRLPTAAHAGAPRVAPDGGRVAFISGGRLSLARPDTGALRRIARVRPVAPAWTPRDPAAIASVAADGTVIVRSARDRVLGRARPMPDPTAVTFTGDGRRLIVSSRFRLSALPGGGHAGWSWRIRHGALGSVRALPGGERLVVTLITRRSTSVALLGGAQPRPRPRVLARSQGFVGPAVPSPEGRWIAVAEPDSRRIVLLPTTAGAVRLVRDPSPNGIVEDWGRST
jgi:hypothetical protein